jgi:hypothetical protein
MKTLTFHGATFADALETFRDIYPRFTVTRTGYTAKVQIHNGGKFLFAEGRVNPTLFPLANKLKAEVLKRGVPTVDRSGIRYFSFNKAQAHQELPRSAYCVDLSSAYVHALRHRKLITGATFNRLLKLPKEERLRVVGMLATTKTRIEYHGGKVTEVKTEQSPTAGAFFAACETTGEIMSMIEEHPAFLFFWVDGAFFDRPVPEVSEFFTAQGFPCKVERIENLRWSKSRKFILYHKDGEQKYLTVPGPKTPSPEWIQKLLNTPNT